MTEQRSVSVAELETLQAVLVQVLPKSDRGDMTTFAVECAKAVRASFDELSRKSTQESSCRASRTAS